VIGLRAVARKDVAELTYGGNNDRMKPNVEHPVRQGPIEFKSIRREEPCPTFELNAKPAMDNGLPWTLDIPRSKSNRKSPSRILGLRADDMSKL
jgi:hypothetical protein